MTLDLSVTGWSTDSVRPLAFRRAMGQFASGVTVVTTVGRDGIPVGCTVSAFCSLSETPPLVLICIGRRRSIYTALIDAPGYAVSILRSDHGEIARAFADSEADQFPNVATTFGRYGIPMLTEAIARIECDRERVLDGGDHIILTGRVMGLALSDGEPLLYSRGRFHDPTAPILE